MDSYECSEEGDREETVEILKKPNYNIQSSIVEHQKPFKLRITPKLEVGRSYVSSVKPIGIPSIVTSKFYQSYEDVNEEDIERLTRMIETKYKQGPRDKYKRPIVESHKYGWYHDAIIPFLNKHDRRFYHGIQDSYFTKMQENITAYEKCMMTGKK